MPRGIAKAQYNADVVKRGTLTASLRLMKPAGRHEPAQPVHELLPSSGKREEEDDERSLLSPSYCVVLLALGTSSPLLNLVNRTSRL